MKWKVLPGLAIVSGLAAGLPMAQDYNYFPPSSPPPTPSGEVLAFPTAAGYGRLAKGGRGGAVCQVTSLADSGAGTLRDCLIRTGPRTVVFRVSGDIVVNSTIKGKGQVTIAGQTAPGGGIQVRNGTTNTTAVQIIGNDAIVRHMRFSPGPTPTRSTNNDAIFFEGEMAIFDHISARWATDENVDVYGKDVNRDITVQWSITAEPLMGTVVAPGAHAYCIMSAGFRQTLHHSLLQDCYLRAPNVATRDQYDMVNSVVHNWNERSLDAYARFAGAGININAIGNWWAMGSSSIRNTGNTPVRLNAGSYIGGTIADYRLYAFGNISWATPNANSSQANIVPSAERPAVVTSPVGPVTVPQNQISGAEQAFRDVMQFAGAMPRDAADARIVNEARTCTGKVLKNETEIINGWPVLAAGTPYPDTDADGMDDNWESAHGVTEGNADPDGDGWTNLEEFINELAGDQDSAGNLIVRTGTGIGPLPAVNCGIAIG